MSMTFYLSVQKQMHNASEQVDANLTNREDDKTLRSIYEQTVLKVHKFQNISGIWMYTLYSIRVSYIFGALENALVQQPKRSKSRG